MYSTLSQRVFVIPESAQCMHHDLIRKFCRLSGKVRYQFQAFPAPDVTKIIFKVNPNSHCPQWDILHILNKQKILQPVLWQLGGSVFPYSEYGCGSRSTQLKKDLTDENSPF